ncbi:TIR domain-containing protein [Pseudomonas sp. 21LCFQ010]|uniref:toll/interleukin-1 receptor domain-containing protein n=1 Tax=Pseudomonas sp. 21LCFQ010 TaxID=2957506 RepID=UPI0020976BE8|nr:TIR domain-containing protein [Pseudomonas sp. 21LCFQ010]MCO8161095.1 TIR domain-containing protein [Pseudomonas sp. 21LCFQ010]
MSVRKKKSEIKRLITAFEREADQFHDISFSILYIENEGTIDPRIFNPSNHAVMLWQYYGKINLKTGTDKFIEDLQTSNLEWGLKGAKLSAYAVIEGQACTLFNRMAKRAASLFNESESSAIKSRILDEILESEIDGTNPPASAVNSDQMAIWLNFLLYYISKTHPGNERRLRIEPDPFTLSLLALEDLLENPKVEKVDKSLSRVGEINFKVALSFPGEHRGFVSKVADTLREELGNDQVFYDYDYQSQLAAPNLDVLLQRIYLDNSDLIVVFLSKEYSEKEWCGLEWRAVREIIKSKDYDKVMLIRFDDEKIDGIFSTDGYVDARKHSEKAIARFILERTQLSPIEPH